MAATAVTSGSGSVSPVPPSLQSVLNDLNWELAQRMARTCDIKETLGKEFFTYAILLAQENQSDLLELFVRRHPELLEMEDESGETLLIAACIHNHGDLVRSLVDWGADPKLNNPLLHAVSRGRLEIVEILFEKRARVNVEAFLLACKNGDEKIALIFYVHHVPLNKQDENGNCALAYAAFLGMETLAEALLSKNAKYDVTYNDGEKEIPILELGGETIRQLLTDRAKLDVVDNSVGMVGSVQ